MKKIYHVQGKSLVESEYVSGMDVYEGDVYAFDQQKIIWIWIGSKSSVDESTVAAWLVNKIDKERDGEPEVITVNQGSEPMIFRENFNLNVVDGGTPGFLKKAKLDIVEYKLFRVYTEVESLTLDESFVEEVELKRNSLKSKDVYVLDSNDAIYCWIGKHANLEEKQMGQKLVQKIDSGRNYLPIQYTIYEGEESKSEEGFYDLIEQLSKLSDEQRKTVSVEDQRELKYHAEEYKTSEQHLRETDAKYETTDPSTRPERQIEAGSDEHKSMIKGIHANNQALPEVGSVAAKVAAIQQKDDSETQQSRDKPSSSEDVSSFTSNQNTGPIYRGEDTSLVDQARISDAEQKTDVNVSSNCVAVDMHALAWQSGKACSVCGMKSMDCPAASSHKESWTRGTSCTECNAKM